MTSLTVTEYMCHNRSQILCSVCRNHNPVLSSLVTYQWECNKSNTTGATSGAGTANPSGAPSVLRRVRVAQSLIFCVVFCMSLFVPLSFLFKPLYYQFFFYLRLLISTLVPSSFSFWFLFSYFPSYMTTLILIKLIVSFVLQFWSSFPLYVLL